MCECVCVRVHAWRGGWGGCGFWEDFICRASAEEGEGGDGHTPHTSNQEPEIPYNRFFTRRRRLPPPPPPPHTHPHTHVHTHPLPTSAVQRYMRDTAEPVMLSEASDLKSFGFFQRPTYETHTHTHTHIHTHTHTRARARTHTRAHLDHGSRVRFPLLPSSACARTHSPQLPPPHHHTERNSSSMHSPKL